jgi:hypothetical protein
MAYHGLLVLIGKSNRNQTYLDSFSTTFFIFVCIIAAVKSEYYERQLYYDKAYIHFVAIYFVIYQFVCRVFSASEYPGWIE